MLPPKTASCLSLCVLLLNLTVPCPGHAHNGSVAIAAPVEGITVDGDLSDWPEGMRAYPIALLAQGDRLDNERDFQGILRIGYDEEGHALCLAVEVRDESVVVGGTRAAPGRGQDGCRVWVDGAHTGEAQESYYVSASGARLLATAADTTVARVAVQRTAHGTQYEWCIRMQPAGRQPGRASPVTGVGMAVDLIDQDEDGSLARMGWAPDLKVHPHKSLGDVVLPGSAGGSGLLGGRLVWENGGGVSRSSLQIRSLEQDSLWVEVRTDRLGYYQVELPAGNYRATPRVNTTGKGHGDAEVEVGGKAQVEELVVALPRGVVREAGRGRRTVTRGRRTLAGAGQWAGAWQTIGVADGLPDPSVTSICQEGGGQLWFATSGGGVVRYDGEQFTTFAVHDGLGDNEVSSVVQDQEGKLWVGAGGSSSMKGGLSCYDGETMLTYTREDGLPGDNVLCLLADQSGNLWIGTDAGVARYDGTAFTTFSTEDGLVHDDVLAMAQDRHGHIWFGTPAGASRYDGNKFDSFTPQDGLGGGVLSIFEDQRGDLWFGTGGNHWLGGGGDTQPGIGVCRLDGGEFTIFGARDGLGTNKVLAITEDRSGNLWFGTGGVDPRDSGVSRYDRERWTVFTTEDGPVSQSVSAVLQDDSGDLWLGTGAGIAQGIAGNGVSRFVGDEIAVFTTEQGLPSNGVMSICEDRRGRVWFGTWEGVCWFDGQRMKPFDQVPGCVYSIREDREGNVWFAAPRSGAYRYDGQNVVRFTTADGLPHMIVCDIAQDRTGNIWLCTGGGGVSRYDGQTFTNFDTRDGLAHDKVRSMFVDRAGQVWAGGWLGGVSRYDGQEFTAFTVADGLGHEWVTHIMEDRRGHLWFSTLGGGASRYDGHTFVNLTTADGLAHDRVTHVMEDRQGHLWFSTWGGGVSRWDGQVFQRLLKGDMLPHDAVQATLQDREGSIWIATEGGVVRLRPRMTPPPVRITRVVAEREYGQVAEVRLPTTQDYLALGFLGTSFKTRPGRLAYVYRLVGHDDEWRTTGDEQVTYTDLPMGEYLFQVKAVDRDLTYSELPAEVRVIVHPPYDRLGLIGGLSVALVGLAFATGYGVRKRRAQLRAERALMHEMEEELQDARRMQMSLMPTAAPEIPGLSVAGRCVSAHHVGGDFFQYFRQDDGIVVTLADVTGHAMEAAIPAVMFSGVLDKQMEIPTTLGERFVGLNRSLCRSLGEYTYVCLSMAEIDPETGSLQVANCGCPYPLHYHAATSSVSEWRMDTYPLGVRRDTAYEVQEGTLQLGDCLVLYPNVA